MIDKTASDTLAITLAGAAVVLLAGGPKIPLKIAATDKNQLNAEGSDTWD